jgi:S1-C subfamily serine protease
MSSLNPAGSPQRRVVPRVTANFGGRLAMLVVWLTGCATTTFVVAEEPSATNESIAARLMASTVTVRIWPAANEAQATIAANVDNIAVGKANRDPVQRRSAHDAQRPAQQREAPPATPVAQQVAPPLASAEVTVCTGVVVAPGWVITSLYPLNLEHVADARFRITEPDGQQSKATPRVVDHYSNLCLLEVDEQRLPALPLGGDAPQVGAAVMTAAAAGIERPIVSRGIVSGVDRSAAPNSLPPLLQCDARTTETSSGAAIVDERGRVMGIVVATTVASDRAGWTFAIPARHVERMLAARRPGELVTLERRRPTVGFTLGAGAQQGMVVVERITPGGPADAAGMRVGDTLVEADGRKLRSAYQAVDLILARQPGETLDVVVERGGERQAVKIKLGGVGATTQTTQNALSNNSALSSNQINVRLIGRDQIEIQNGAVADPAAASNAPARSAPRDQLGMLQAQVAAFEKVIGKLQAEVLRRDQLLVETNELVKSLSAEVEELRKQRLAAPETKGKPAEAK